MLSHRIRTFIAAVIYVVFAIPCQAKGPITLMAHSTGPGQWVGHYAEPLNEQDLKPFVGQYLLAGQWPKGVNRPDDPKLLLGRQKLGATRVVAVKVEEGGHLVRLTTDPVVSPEVHQLTIGDVTLAVAFWGLSVKIGAGDLPDHGPKMVLPMLMDRKKLAEYAGFEPALKAVESAWIDPKQPLMMHGWLRLAEGEHELTFLLGREFTLEINGEKTGSKAAGGRYFASLKLESAGTEMELKVVLPATELPISETDFWEVTKLARKESAASSQVLSMENFLVPWAPEAAPEATLAIAPPPYDLTGGDGVQGRQVFYSEAAKCANCHAVDGQGGKIGPDLTGLRGADRSLVFHHINAPSDRIHPGYPSFSVALKGGQVSMGVVRSVDALNLEIVDTDAKVLKVLSADVEELRPSTSSVMPSGLAGTLGEPAMRDLLEFLTVKPK